MEIIHVDVYGPLYVAARGGFFYFMNFRRWFEWMDRSIWWERSLKNIWSGSKNFHEVEIIVTRKSNIYGWIIEDNIWVTSLANIIRVEELSHNFWLPKRHKCMECSRDIIKPCSTWWNIWCYIYLPLYFWGLCFRDYRFYTEKCAIIIRWIDTIWVMAWDKTQIIFS